MTFEDKKNKALAIIDEKKMWRSNCVPLQLKLMWKLGLKYPPLPFAAFWLNTLVLGAVFGLNFGLLMWIFIWKNQDMPIQHALLLSLFSAFVFGFLISLFHLWRKKANALPKWKDL